MSVNGLESTRGAGVDVTFRGFRRVGGILWPTDFDERIRVPFDNRQRAVTGVVVA